MRKELKIACQETYNKLNELDELIRIDAMSKSKSWDDIVFDIAEDLIEALSVARGRILTFSGGFDDD